MKTVGKIKVWQTISSKYVYESKWLKVRHDEVIAPDGKAGIYDVIEKNHFVLIIPKVGNEFYLVEQYRYPVKERSLEFPQGHVEDKEKLETALNRELSEETGLTSNNFVRLGFLWLACGHHTQGFHIFLTNDCREVNKNIHFGTESDMITSVLSQKEIEKRITDGIIKDSPTVAAYCLFKLK